MERSDVSTVVVVGALVGLLFIALGYGQMVWMARQNRLRAHNPEPGSPVISAVFWCCLGLAGASLLYSFVNRPLPEREGLLTAEGLFSVKPRAGLSATYV